jgi:hypothetical protein
MQLYHEFGYNMGEVMSPLNFVLCCCLAKKLF